MKTLRAGVLEVAYEEHGDPGAPPTVLLHGFPYDVHAFDEVWPLLPGARVIVPYLRGYGPTRFLSEATPRSGQQAALAKDLLTLLDALGIPKAVLAGFDWGGRAACIVAALFPERCAGLVTVNGYNVHDLAASGQPSSPENEYRYWYQWYFHGERGQKGLAQNRRELCRLLWRLWSPRWQFNEETFARTAASFDNPDFVEVVIHSYRARYRLAAGDPAYEELEQRLVEKPAIRVPTISLDGTADGVMVTSSSEGGRAHFTGPYQHRLVEGAGHNVPQERPAEFAAALRDCVKL
ncbi:MAG TPA: alpha/beta hydrolase [Myxococcales bacterium]|jgi:pimeloyl-ACP methyl ester carboxylesterase